MSWKKQAVPRAKTAEIAKTDSKLKSHIRHTTVDDTRRKTFLIFDSVKGGTLSAAQNGNTKI